MPNLPSAFKVQYRGTSTMLSVEIANPNYSFWTTEMIVGAVIVRSLEPGGFHDHIRFTARQREIEKCRIVPAQQRRAFPYHFRELCRCNTVDGSLRQNCYGEFGLLRPCENFARGIAP